MIYTSTHDYFVFGGHAHSLYYQPYTRIKLHVEQENYALSSYFLMAKSIVNKVLSWFSLVLFRLSTQQSTARAELPGYRKRDINIYSHDF